MAATYATKELGLADSVLIPTILLIQLVGMLGAWLFARISGRYGNIRALIISIIIWILVMYWRYILSPMPLVLSWLP